MDYPTGLSTGYRKCESIHKQNQGSGHLQYLPVLIRFAYSIHSVYLKSIYYYSEYVPPCSCLVHLQTLELDGRIKGVYEFHSDKYSGSKFAETVKR
jgi:hypothetical protein